MATAQSPPLSSTDLRVLQDNMGRVYHQPVGVHSFTNKRFTVNYRAPIDQVRKLLPPSIEPDEIRDTGMGMFGMCACDFWVTRLGWLPIPRIRNNDMLFRVSARVRKGGSTRRAFYTIGSNSSSRLLGFLGQRFSHFRKRVSNFNRIDNESEYALECIDADPLAQGKLRADLSSVSKVRPNRPSSLTFAMPPNSCSILTEVAVTTLQKKSCPINASITRNGTCISATDATTIFPCWTISLNRSRLTRNLIPSCS